MELDLSKVLSELRKRARIWVTKALPVLMEELKKLTPEDTKEMLNSYKVLETKEYADRVEWSITNDSEHAIFVEYGVKWKEYDYHKPAWKDPRPVIYTGEGNRTFARAVDNKRNTISSIIQQALNA